MPGKLKVLDVAHSYQGKRLAAIRAKPRKYSTFKLRKYAAERKNPFLKRWKITYKTGILFPQSTFSSTGRVSTWEPPKLSLFTARFSCCKGKISGNSFGSFQRSLAGLQTELSAREKPDYLQPRYPWIPPRLASRRILSTPYSTQGDAIPQILFTRIWQTGIRRSTAIHLPKEINGSQLYSSVDHWNSFGFFNSPFSVSNLRIKAVAVHTCLEIN